MKTAWMRRIFTIRQLIFTGVYTLGGTAVIFLLFHCLGTLAGLFTNSEYLLAVFSQFSKTSIMVPFWLLLIGAVAACAVWVLFRKKVKHKAAKILIISGIALFLLAVFVVALLLTKINNVPVHTEIRIILSLFKSDELSQGV